MADWKTRLVVTYDEGGSPVEISPIDAFTPTFAMGGEILHSIERTHIGMIFSPESISFSITVKAIGDVAAKLTALALSRKRFNITLKEQVGNDWAFSTVVLTECLITNATPTAATISGAPSATFSGVSLAASATDNGSQATKLPASQQS